MRIEHLRGQLRELGAKPCHEDRVLRAWAKAQPLDSGGVSEAKDFLPLSIRNALPKISREWQNLASVHTRVQTQQAGTDSAERLLVALQDGQMVESVLLPRNALCVSTQVGCAVGCVFCMTGKSGLLRQLGSAEIVAQVVLARKLRPVKKVVFMGMGEPCHNLDNVCEAIDFLGTAGSIAHKNLVFSTVGDVRVFERLEAMRVKPALAISLHTTDAALRAKLLPKAPSVNIADLVEMGERYARATGYPIQYQWTLLAGINDADEEVQKIERLLRGKHAMMNFIPFNASEGLPYTRPSSERAVFLAGSLQRLGLVTTLRDSAGQDIDGGCGQLRARSA